MLASLLSRAVALSESRPWTVVLGWVAVCSLLGSLALTVPVELTILSIIDTEDPDVAHFYEVSDEVRALHRLALLVEGPDLDEAVEDLRALEELPQVAEVNAGRPIDWLERRAPYLAPRPVFDLWLEAATTAPDRARNERLERELAALQDEVEARFPPEARLVEVVLTEDPTTAPMGAPAFQAVDARTQEILAGHAAQGRYAGLAAIAGQDQERVLRNVGRLTPLGILAVLLLLRVVERRPLQVLAVGAPMALASIATVGAVGWLLGSISVMESFFGVLVFGLGVDFALHLLVRLREERVAGQPFPQALRATVHGAGPGIVAGGLTTAGAFGLLALAPDNAARHLGLSGAIGLALCCAAMLTLLPALWTLLDRRGSHSEPTELRIPGLEALAQLGVQRPKTVLGLAVLAMAVALAGFPRFHFDTDLAGVFSRELPALETADRIHEIWGVDPQPWMALTDSLDEARALSAALEADPTFERAESLGTLLPADGAERQAALRQALPRLQQAQLMLSMAGSSADVGTLIQAALDGAPRVEDVPASLRSGWQTESGRFVVRAWPPEPSLDGRIARDQRLAAQAIAPEATSLGVVLEKTMGGDRPWLPWLFGGIAAFVLTVLALDLRSVRWVAIATAPVLFGATCCVGVFCWAGVSFNVDTVLVMPLLIGLGVDDGIHVVHRIRALGGPVADGAVSVGRAIVMTTCTTVASVLAFLFSSHQGLESLALVADRRAAPVPARDGGPGPGAGLAQIALRNARMSASSPACSGQAVAVRRLGTSSLSKRSPAWQWAQPEVRNAFSPVFCCSVSAASSPSSHRSNAASVVDANTRLAWSRRSRPWGTPGVCSWACSGAGSVEHDSNTISTGTPRFGRGPRPARRARRHRTRPGRGATRRARA